MAQRRIEKAEKEIKGVVGRFLSSGLKSPLPGLVSVVDAHLSPDLRSGQVFLGYLGAPEDRQETHDILTEEWPSLQRELGRQLRMKYCPKLRFRLNQPNSEPDPLEKMIAQLGRPD